MLYTWTFSAIKYVCIRMYMCTVKFVCNTLLLKENFSKPYSELVSSACRWVFKGVIFVNITQHLTDHIRTTYSYFENAHFQQFSCLEESCHCPPTTLDGGPESTQHRAEWHGTQEDNCTLLNRGMHVQFLQAVIQSTGTWNIWLIHHTLNRWGVCTCIWSSG